MEKVIYLEADEEITSVIDRIREINEDKVALVLPKRANLLQSIVNLKLLKRQIDSMNKEVVIVTTDKLGRNLASQVGFIVYQKLGEKPVDVEQKKEVQKPLETKIGYRSPEEPQRPEPQFKIGPSVTDITYRKEEEMHPPKPETEIVSEHHEHKPTPKPISHRPHIVKKSDGKAMYNKKIALIVGIAVIVIAALVCFIILPKANVSLLLKSEVSEQSFNMIVDKNIKSPNFDQITLPGISVSGSKEDTGKNLACTGKKNIGQKASGPIVISNSFDENPQGLVANTRLVSAANGKTYRLTTAVDVPGAKVSGGNIVPGTVSATVQADEPGESYNIASTHFTIPGLSGTAKYDKIYADTTSVIRGGFTQEITVLSQADVDSNKEKMVSDLSSKLNQELVDKNKDKTVFLNGVKPVVVETTPSVPVDTESAKFDLKVKIKTSTLAANNNDFNYLLYKKLANSLPSDKELVEDSLKDTKTEVSTYDEKTGKESVKVDAKGYITTKIDKDKIKEAIAGKSQNEAATYLASLKDVAEAKVDLWPFWVRSVPRFLTRNIYIVTEVQKK